VTDSTPATAATESALDAGKNGAMSEPKIPTIDAMHAMSVDDVRAHLRRFVADLPPEERREVGVLAGNSYVMLIAGRIEFLTGAHKAEVLRDALRGADAT
jgi:hypothetical protein